MADKVINKKQALLDNSVIESLVDEQLSHLIQELPDPDVILRKANIDHDVYREIMADPHVIGEVRSLRAGLLKFKYEIKAGDDTSQAQQALELCESLLERRPHAAMSWPDLTWSIGKAPLVGRRVHHVEWEMQGKYIVPKRIFDISTRAYCFNRDGELLIRTIDKPEGEIAEDYRWLVTRHMADRENPYGVALLSACFWPWMFKNGGIKFFVKFCEKLGIPWPVIHYPIGTQKDEVNEIVSQVAQMVEDAVAAVPEGMEVNLLETKASGELPQERLANFMNREMSKALTSQSLATEINGQGSRAAAETHSARTEVNQKTDRKLEADTKNELFAWVTMLNFGPDVAPPIYTHVDKKELNVSDVAFFERTTRLVPVKKEDIYKRLEISEPGENDEVIFRGDGQDQDEDDEPAQFSRADQDYSTEDTAISDLVEQVKQAIDEGATFKAALDNIVNLIPEFEQAALDDIVRREFELQFGKGMLEANQ